MASPGPLAAACPEDLDPQAHLRAVTPAMDRRNGRIFCASFVLKYFAAPVGYVGVVQAALCDKLGAGPAVSNLPAAAYLFGHFAPLVLSSFIPSRRVRAVVVAAYAATTILLAAVCTLLVFPVPTPVRLGAVIGHGLVQGFSGSISNVYVWQCLARGTTLDGRARALKLTYTVGPISAIAGSLAAQFVLGGGVPALPYLYDFAALYLVGVVTMGIVTLISSRYELIAISEEPRTPFLRHMADSIRSYGRSRVLVLLWFAYLLWYSTLNGMTNLSLYTRVAIGREPKELSGLIMALRFGFKALAGFVLGVIALRRGMRAPLTTTVLLLGAAIAWAWIAPGYAYLVAFGLLGAGELGGVYFPNYLVAISPAATGTRNLALLTLVSCASSVAPILYGGLTQLFGFRAAFALGAVLAASSLWLVTKLPRMQGSDTGGKR